MYPLSIELIFYKIFLYLDLKSIIRLGMVNKDFKLLCDDDDIWRMAFFEKPYNNKKLYKQIVIGTFLKNNTKICHICYRPLFVDVVITMHNCNLLKKCINCKNNSCTCTSITYCHENCIKNIDNYYYCFFCKNKIKGYLIKVLI